jgi:HlyD family secretion protein
MTATAEIVVGQRTVLSYFLYPLIRVVDEAIRER